MRSQPGSVPSFEGPMKRLSAVVILGCLLFVKMEPLAAQDLHIYLANDNHTDFFWSADEAAYYAVAVNEIDYYLDLANTTAGLPAAYQSRYNLDGAWYVYAYQQQKSAAGFKRLLDRLRSGHFSMPLNFLVSTYGGQPTEAVLRGMYWPGRLARQEGLDVTLAVSMENHTLPLGLASLWAGSGARYSWKGVCGCSTPVGNSKLSSRDHEIYRYQGLDGSEVLMKWYSFQGFASLGGYGESKNLLTSIERCADKCNSPKYPFSIAGAFGYGEDELEVRIDDYSEVAREQSNGTRQIYVSNEADFFRHFEQNYPLSQLPAESLTYGNDWDVDCASMASVTANIRNAVEKLRTAEAMASVVALIDASAYTSLATEREQAWIALGSYWEHNFGLGGCCYEERAEWGIKLQNQVSDYVNHLYQSSLQQLTQHMSSPAGKERFFVFNPLGWARTDWAEVPYDGPGSIKVIDLASGKETPYQIITRGNSRFLRILASDIPSVGYTVFEIQTGSPAGADNAATLSGRVFENAFYRLTVTSEGAVTSLIDKMNGNREFVNGTQGRFVNDFGQGGGDGGTLTLLDNGPVSATISCTSANPLQHTTYITLYRDIDRIDISNRITDDFGDDIRTYAFPFKIDQPTVWHEELGAVIKAKYTTSGGHYATPDKPVGHAWQTLNHFADVGNETAGITLSNQGAAFMKLGNSDTEFLDQESSRINVLIGGRMAGSGPGFANQYGQKNFENDFSLRTRSTSFSAPQAMKFAMAHQNPLVAAKLPTNSNGGFLPETTFSLLASSDPNVLLWALKPSEDGTSAGELVLRWWNLDDQSHPLDVDFATRLRSGYRTTHLETDLEPAMINENSLLGQLGKYKLETYRVAADPLSPITSIRPGPEREWGISVYPNPGNNTIFVEVPPGSEKVILRVHQLGGQLLLQRTLVKPLSALDVKGWTKGLYLFSFDDGNQQTYRKVIID